LTSVVTQTVIARGLSLKLYLLYTLVQWIIIPELMFCWSTNHSCYGPLLQFVEVKILLFRTTHVWCRHTTRAGEKLLFSPALSLSSSHNSLASVRLDCLLPTDRSTELSSVLQHPKFSWIWEYLAAWMYIAVPLFPKHLKTLSSSARAASRTNAWSFSSLIAGLGAGGGA
jgi:hypothetical protein